MELDSFFGMYIAKSLFLAYTIDSLLRKVRDTMEIERNYYLNKLIAKKENKLIKIITGIRRSGNNVKFVIM